jgi:hypothetical protein
MNRDYADEMRKLIDEYRSQSSYNASLAAHEIVNRLMAENQELLDGWLKLHAVQTIRSAMASADAATRAHARGTGSSVSVFAEAARRAEEGDPTALKEGWLQGVYTINAEHDRKALKDMTAEDVLFVASRYEDQSRAAMLEAAFFRALAKKIGMGRVADSFNNTQLAELRQRIVGGR